MLPIFHWCRHSVEDILFFLSHFLLYVAVFHHVYTSLRYECRKHPCVSCGRTFYSQIDLFLMQVLGWLVLVILFGIWMKNSRAEIPLFRNGPTT